MEAFGRIVSANEMEQLSSLLDFFYFLYLLWSCGETSGVWGLRAVILSHFLVSHERVEVLMDTTTGTLCASN